MGFWTDWVWWLLAGLSVVSFARYCRPGIADTPASVKTVGRAVFIMVVVLAFVLYGRMGGIVVCLGGGVVGMILPWLLSRLFIEPASTASATATRSLEPVLPSMGLPAVVRDMAQNGISRAKVWRLIYHGRLLAFEDPKDGKVTLVRPEDMQAMESAAIDSENDELR